MNIKVLHLVHEVDDARDERGTILRKCFYVTESKENVHHNYSSAVSVSTLLHYSLFFFFLYSHFSVGLMWAGWVETRFTQKR